MERRNSAKGLGVPVPENGAFPQRENTRGMARSMRREPSYQLGKMIPVSLSLPARSRATRMDGSHHMSNKLTFFPLAFLLCIVLVHQEPWPWLRSHRTGRLSCELRVDTAKCPKGWK